MTSPSPMPEQAAPDRITLIVLVFLLSRIGRVNQTLLAKVQADLVKAEKKPRSESECHVLISLFLQGEPYLLSPTTLCEASLQTPGGMTKTLNRLEADGLIRRRTDKNDRRALLVELTARGVRQTKVLLDQTLGGYAEAFSSIPLSRLKDVVVALRTALTTLEIATGTEPTDMWVNVDRAGGEHSAS